MNKSSQPFTEHVTRSHPQSARLQWIFVITSIIFIAASVFFWRLAENNRRQVKSLQSELNGATETISDAFERQQINEDEIEQLKQQLAELERERETVTQKARSLEEEMRADLESKDVTISKLQGKLTVNILDRIMFDSGEAVLKSEGQAVMQKIAALLTDHPDLKIHVVGHTDNIPLRSGARFPSNWELSTARALAALHFLVEKAGVDPHRVGAVGYGEYRPIADNSTAEGRAKNRRIAITILPDELAGADTAAATPVLDSELSGKP